MKLRLASVEDASMLEAVHARAFDAGWTAEDITRLMHILGGFSLIAEDETGAAGFILARVMADEAEILTLAVAPWARRRGVASALVEAVALEAERRNARAIFLEVAADNEAAIELYGRLRFERAGLRRAYYGRPGAAAVDAFVLRRPLNRAPA